MVTLLKSQNLVANPLPLAEEPMDQYSESTVPMSSSVPSKTETVSASSQSADPTATTVVSSSTSNSSPSSEQTSAQTSGSFDRPHPIPPASEPMQYRAIGLVKAIYKPSEEQFTRGELIHENGCSFGAVLLGRVMSLVKKHIDLDQPHLWVVYPRTRQKHNELHLQIVGVWEPETLNRPDDEQSSEASDADASPESGLSESDSSIAEEPEMPIAEAAESSEPESSESAGQALDASSEAIATEAVSSESESGLTPPKKPVPPKPPTPPKPTAESETPPSLPEVDDGYFSIRGEIVHYAAQAEQVTVKIEQASRRADNQSKPFKLTLNGALEGRTLYHFWDLYVRLQENELVIQEGQRIGVVRPKQPPKGIKSNRINKIHKKGSKPKGTKFGSSAPVKESDASDAAVKPLESAAPVAEQPTSTEVAPPPTSTTPDPTPVAESVATPEVEAAATPAVESEPARVAPAAEPDVPAEPVAEPVADSTVAPTVEASTASEPVEAKADSVSDVEPATPEISADEVAKPVAEPDVTPEEEPVAEEPVVEEPVAEEPVVKEPVVEEPMAEEPKAKKAKKSGKSQSKSKKSSS